MNASAADMRDTPAQPANAQIAIQIANRQQAQIANIRFHLVD